MPTPSSHPPSPSDSVPDPLSTHFSTHLASRAYPKTLCPSEIARSLSREELVALPGNVSTWRDLMPRLREMAFAARDRGEIEILQRGEVLGPEIRGIEDVRGPIRIRRKINDAEASR